MCVFALTSIMKYKTDQSNCLFDRFYVVKWLANDMSFSHLVLPTSPVTSVTTKRNFFVNIALRRAYMK